MDSPACTVACETFGTNDSSPRDFGAAIQDGDSLLVGARNAIFDISLVTLTENRRIVWTPSLVDETRCKKLWKNVDACQNYVNFLSQKEDNELLACGTNAKSPYCRTYHNFTTGKDLESGAVEVPYSPSQNSTALFVGNRWFVATVADLQGRDPLIYSERIRTERYNTNWLNAPHFVLSFEYSDNVYFVFREIAVEHANCEQVAFSRVARVCKNDRGGARILKETWTSYFKARLNCSIPGEVPFYFNEVHATTKLGKGNYRASAVVSSRTKMFYGVFNTPGGSFSGSAVCAFRLQDILESFEGPFKGQNTPQSNWVPVKDAPTPHPARSCPNDSMTLSDQTLGFIKNHPLMDKAVLAFGGAPIITAADYRMTTITVDWQVKASDDKYYDVLFIGTDDGRVIKAVNVGARIQPVIIEEVQVFMNTSSVQSLQIYRRDNTDKLVIIGTDEIKTIPLARCQAQDTCGECVGLQDPHCSWNIDHCTRSRLGIQNLVIGRHPYCDKWDSSPTITLKAVPTTTITVALAAVLLLAIVCSLGLIVGFACMHQFRENKLQSHQQGAFVTHCELC
jgi:semaphorin 6